MRNIVEDDYANTCNGARTQIHTLTKLNQVTHHAQVDPVQTQSGNICAHTHTHTGEHKPTYPDSVPDWKGNSPFVSLRCFFSVNTQNKAPLRVNQPQLQSQDTFVIQTLCTMKCTSSARSLLLFMVQEKCSSVDVWFGNERICRKFKVQRVQTQTNAVSIFWFLCLCVNAHLQNRPLYCRGSFVIATTF